MFTNAISALARVQGPDPHARRNSARHLGLKTLAEGVETTDEIDQLRDAHVDEAQGFLFARPLDPDALETQILVPARPPAAAHPSRTPDLRKR